VVHGSGTGSRDPGRDEDPERVLSWPAWMDDPACLAARADEEDPGDPDLCEDPDNAPPPGLGDDELAALIAGAPEVTELIRWPSFCSMMDAWTTSRNFWRKPSSGRVCTPV
jgi:hypothetical protein